MLEQLFEFIVNHWLLSAIWLTLLILLIRNEGARGGKALTPTEVTQLINKQDAQVLDIRNKDEFRNGHLPNAINIPAKDVQKRITELNNYKEKPLIIVCKTGTTAGATGAILAKEGFSNLSKLKGGILEWTGSNLPLVKN